jgi:hypothetical protein
VKIPVDVLNSALKASRNQAIRREDLQQVRRYGVVANACELNAKFNGRHAEVHSRFHSYSLLESSTVRETHPLPNESSLTARKLKIDCRN